MNPRVCAHRGFAARYPENTLLSVSAALELGLRFVEIDVQLTKDQVPVLYHDAGLERVSGVKGDVRKLDWAQARKLKITALSGLAPCFARYPRARLFVELKEESMRHVGREAVLSAVLKAIQPFQRRCILISFDLRALAMVRKAMRLPIGCVLRNSRQLKSAPLRLLEPEWVFRDLRDLPLQGGLALPSWPGGSRPRQCVWEVPDPQVADALFKRGIDLIETFAVDHYL